jgi:hypothetical protein
MGLGGKITCTWDEMRHAFLKKYQDYCKERYLHEEIFNMTCNDDESLEDYVERL